MLLVNIYFNFVLYMNTEKLVLLTNELFLIKCCCRIKKTKLTRECCDMKPSQMPPLQNHRDGFWPILCCSGIVFFRAYYVLL